MATSERNTMAVVVRMNVARRSRIRVACTGSVVGSSRERAVVAYDIVSTGPSIKLKTTYLAQRQRCLARDERHSKRHEIDSLAA